jgi:hydrogenase maturation factor
MEIDETKFIYPEEIKAVCEAFNIDSVAAIAEGSLILTSESSYTEKILKRLKKEHINASIIGKVTDNVNSRFIKRIGGRTERLEIPAQDPFWPVFFEGIKNV